MTRVMVIVGSARPGRIGLPIGRWVERELGRFEDVDIDFVDLGELRLPLMDEPNHPRLRRYTHEHTLEWSRRVEAADAFVLVAPEYNHSYSPALKNALDYLSAEWRRKPVAFVSYGGVSAGTRGVAALKPVLAALGLVHTQATVEINFPGNLLEGEVFGATESLQTRLDGALEELLELADGLAPLRSAGLDGHGIGVRQRARVPVA
ncbi:MAG TPA: NAD(P)H-dependent oxidoreductase [Naasia sp.]|jgi:NAD(P)H-dependent FMN reductase